jgi:hypothetical protein
MRYVRIVDAALLNTLMLSVSCFMSSTHFQAKIVLY